MGWHRGTGGGKSWRQVRGHVWEVMATSTVLPSGTIVGHEEPDRLGGSPDEQRADSVAVASDRNLHERVRFYMDARPRQPCAGPGAGAGRSRGRRAGPPPTPRRGRLMQ